MDGKSFDMRQEQIDKLKEFFPEAVSEGKVDWEKLRLTLGEDITIDNERYVLNWAGKSDAFRAIQTPTTATLKPQPEQSVDFAKTENVFIEGENLEVLKVLQKSYYGKVKMIYIDPPYNTGNDSFIYPDKFSETKDEYLRRIGDKDEAGYLTKEGFFRKNSKENGQYHSNWLSMMYPRLFLARNLLRDDGVIFVSIDDNEVHNLRLVMNEIFGEENFVATIIWQKKQSPQNDATYFSDMHDYILVYAKRVKLSKVDPEGWQRALIDRDEEQVGRYSNPDNDPRGDWASVDCTSNKSAEQRPNLYYPVKNPHNDFDVWPPKQRVWRFERKTMAKLLEENRIWWGEKGDNFPRLKRFISEVQGGVVPSTWWPREFAGDNQAARREIRTMFPEGAVDFETVKPASLVRRLIGISSPKAQADSDIILDFFAGSGTTAQAVMELNKEDGGNRNFILVQLPEKTDEDSEAYKAGYRTIADICKERIRRAIKKVSEPQITADDADVADKKKKQLAMDLDGAVADSKSAESHSSKLSAVGFKVFTLELSNFKVWRTDTIENGDDLVKQMDAFADPVRAGSDAEAMAWEILVKSGYELTTKLERFEHGGVPLFSIAGGEVFLAFEKISQKAIDEVVKMKPKTFICLDRLFAGNDQLKTNTALQLKDAGVEFKSV